MSQPHNRAIATGDKGVYGDRQPTAGGYRIKKKPRFLKAKIAGIYFIRGKHEGEKLYDTPTEYLESLIKNGKMNKKEAYLIRKTLNYRKKFPDLPKDKS